VKALHQEYFGQSYKRTSVCYDVSDHYSNWSATWDRADASQSLKDSLKTCQEKPNARSVEKSKNYNLSS